MPMTFGHIPPDITLSKAEREADRAAWGALEAENKFASLNTSEQAVALFRWWIKQGDQIGHCEMARHVLSGKNLACWCALDQPCHADVLLEVVN